MIRTIYILKGDKFMETIDFRTWKQKRDEASNKIKIGFQN